MDAAFQERFRSIVAAFDRLIASAPIRLPLGSVKIPDCGIYLFTENGQHFYVGRSDNIRRRLGLHTRPASAHNQASFATLLAKEECQLVADYRYQRIHPQHYSNQQAFRDAFASAKARVRLMDIRVVEETDAVNQALLEVYTAVVLPTRYNDFKNH